MKWNVTIVNGEKTQPHDFPTFKSALYYLANALVIEARKTARGLGGRTPAAITGFRGTISGPGGAMWWNDIKVLVAGKANRMLGQDPLNELINSYVGAESRRGGYMVMCFDERGRYVEATSVVWPVKDAAVGYSLTVSPSRHPIVVEITAKALAKRGELGTAKTPRAVDPGDWMSGGAGYDDGPGGPPTIGNKGLSGY